VQELARLAGRLPDFIRDMEAAAATIAHRGLRLDPDSLRAFQKANGDRTWLLWAAIAVLALALLFGR
jgi:hypothetical protein